MTINYQNGVILSSIILSILITLDIKRGCVYGIKDIPMISIMILSSYIGR